MSTTNAEFGVVLLACLAAVVTDLRARKIPNVIPGIVAVAALGFAAAHGLGAFFTAFGLGLGTLVVGTFAFAAGWLGGGDVKLLAAVCAALSPGQALAFLIYTAIAGGLIAIAFAIATGRLASTISSVGDLVRPYAVPGTVAAAPSTPTTMPYALAIAAGFIAVVLSQSVTPFLRLPL